MSKKNRCDVIRLIKGNKQKLNIRTTIPEIQKIQKLYV